MICQYQLLKCESEHRRKHRFIVKIVSSYRNCFSLCCFLIKFDKQRQKSSVVFLLSSRDGDFIDRIRIFLLALFSNKLVNRFQSMSTNIQLY